MATSEQANLSNLVSVFSKQHPWAVYQVTLEFTGQLVGGAPSDPRLVEGWLGKNLGITDEEEIGRYARRHLLEVQGIDPDSGPLPDEAVEAVLDDAAAEKKAQVFKRTPGGLPYIEGRHVKSMLKEATSIAYPIGQHKWGRFAGTGKSAGRQVGGKDPKAFLAERVFVSNNVIVVGTEITGVELAVGHIPDFRAESGKRSTIGYYEYIEGAAISFEVRALDDCITNEQWARIWSVAEENGLGARRSQGAGKFVITSWDRIR